MSVLIIAEAGVNHNGSLETALKMVHEAKAAGADAVKFQTFWADEITTPDAPKAGYQKVTDIAPSQYEMLKRLELDRDDFIKISRECDKIGIEFMSTPFSVSAAGFLAEIGMKTWKIPSGEITNLPLLEYVGSVASRIVMSTGMSRMDEIADAVDVLEKAGAKRDAVFLLHCTTAYPTPPADVNLRAMETLRRFEVAGVGYSDHTRGITVPLAAVAMGAQIIEKHFTLDRTLAGPDHSASVDPKELSEMVKGIREVELALGNGFKEPVASEIPNIEIARKSIVALKDIEEGEIFATDNITAKRPGTGLSPMKWHDLLGRRAIRSYKKNEFIQKDEIK